MGNIPNPWEEFLKIEETHGRLIDSMMYVLKECGGLAWPLLYLCLLFSGWDALNSVGRSVFVLLGIILISIAILYPYAWKRYYKRFHNDYKIFVDDKAQSLFEFVDRVPLIIGEKEADPKEFKVKIQDLQDSLSAFKRKYFSHS